MKLVKKFVVALLFVSALAVPTLAGDMDTPTFSAPPPPPSSLTISTVTTDQTAETTPVVTDVADDSADAYKLFYEACLAILGLY